MKLTLNTLTYGLLFLATANATPVRNPTDGDLSTLATTDKTKCDKLCHLSNDLDKLDKKIEDEKNTVFEEEDMIRSTIIDIQKEDKKTHHKRCPRIRGKHFPTDLDPEAIDFDQVDWMYTHKKKKDRKNLLEMINEVPLKHGKEDDEEDDGDEEELLVSMVKDPEVKKAESEKKEKKKNLKAMKQRKKRTMKWVTDFQNYRESCAR